MKVETLPGCGARIHGVDARSASDEEISAIRNALAQHGVVFMDGEVLAPDEQLAFARRFGDIVVNRYFDRHAEYPELAKVEKTPEQERAIGSNWHTDHSYDEEPAMGSMLMAVIMPQSGGDTWFANMYAAYVGLPQELKDRIEGLRAVHDTQHVFGRSSPLAGGERDAMTRNPDLPRAVHPIAIRHPDSGKRALYVNPIFTTGIEGLDQAEADALLNQLYEHAQKPEYTYRHSWKPGTIAFWDNRSTWHRAMNDYQGQHRLMHRVTLVGGKLE